MMDNPTWLAARAFTCRNAFDRLAADAAAATDLDLRIDLMRAAARAATAFDDDLTAAAAHLDQLPASLLALPAQIAGRDLAERLTTSYIGWGPIEELVTGVGRARRSAEKVATIGIGTYAIEWLTGQCARCETTSSRLALWARRIMGDSLRASEDLAVALGVQCEDLATQFTTAHARRMATLKLTA